MPSADSYPSHKRSKVNRYRNRAVYDFDFIHGVVDTASIVTVAFPPSLEPDADPFPAVLPMIGCTGRYEEPDDSENKTKDVYLHGYVSSRLMRLSKTATDEEDESNGLPVTLSATLVDGIVLSLTPNSHSYNYRSAVVHGFAKPVTDTEEKLWAMRLITNSVMPDRWENTRTPPTETEMTTTQILRVKIMNASGKERAGGPHDEPFDLENHEMTKNVWTGVVPIWEVRGAPVRSVTENKEKVPSYLEQAIQKANTERETKSFDAMGDEVIRNHAGEKSLLQRIMNFGGN